MLLLLLAIILTLYYGVPAVASIWSIYGLIKWQGIWRILAAPPLVIAAIILVYNLGIDHLGFPRSRALVDDTLKVDLAMIPYVFFVALFHRDAQKKRSGGNGNADESAASTKRIFIPIVVMIALGAIICAGYYYFSYKRGIERSGYEVAGIEPIAGAKMLSANFPHSSMFGGTTIWVYQLPAGYGPSLYKDCSRIGYKQGTYRDHDDGDYEVNQYIAVKPGDAGCYLEKFTEKDGDVTAQFVRDELYVYDVY